MTKSARRSRSTHKRKAFRFKLVIALLAISAIALVAGTSAFSLRFPGASAAAQAEENGISPEALAQIEALILEKESRTPTERKMDSQLIYELKMDRGEAVANGVRTLETDLPVSDTGKTVVDISANVSDGLLLQLRENGADIISVVPERDSVRASVSLDDLESVAALADVKFIQPKQDAVTSGLTEQVIDDRHSGTTKSVKPGYANRVSHVRNLLAAALQDPYDTSVSGSVPPTGVGSQTTEGDATHRAASARGTFHTNGTGVKIGVLSDGVSNLAASQALGDLGPVTILPGQAGSGDEGTAMLEIVHDIAPGAQLYFATAFTSITSFAQNIRDLRTAGCDIIIDDVFYFVETPFQDGQLAPTNTNGGVVIQAVNDVTASGAMYFSSAGNSGNLNDGTSGVWEGDFVNGGNTSSPLPVGQVHRFGAQNFNTLTVAGSGPINLYWSDPLGGSSNDYDLFRLNAAGTAVAASSTNIQNGTQDPYEQVTANTSNPRIVIVKKNSAQPRFLHLNANRGRFSIVTAGQTHGHSAAVNAFSCAATPARGPFPNPFNGSNTVETFSSDGPRRVFFQSNGAPYTPGNLSSTGGVLRQKPDITAADGVAVTGVGGFSNPFFGTSAAAPHAGALAALLKSANPVLTPAQIRAALTSSAIDIEAAGVDRDSGAGIIMAYSALQAAGVTGTAFLEFGAITANEDPGDGNGLIDAGDGASLTIQLRNTGVAGASAINATLTSATPGVTVHTPNTSPYPDLGVGGIGTNAMPFRFTVASNVACPATLQFTLTVNFTGGVSPQVMHFSVPSGPPAVNISSTLDTTAPASGAGFTGSTGTIATRHFRDGVASSCGTAKAFPGTTAPGTRQYDAYTFQTCPNSAPSCITVTFAGANAINMFSAAYTGTFNPANLAQGYLADPGASAATRTYSFNLPGGVQTFTVIVYDVNPGAASNSAYTLNISGGCIGSCAPPNQVPVAKAKNVTVSAGPDCTADASVDDGSFDPDGDPLTITQSPAGPYPLGTTNVLLTVKDPRGATSQATATVTVVDSTGPDVSDVSASPNMLWPPNHLMVPVQIDYTTADSCSSGGSCVLSVSSNEPINGLGDGDTSPDWAVVDEHNVQVRSERSGRGTGRIYTITIDCTDGAGNHTIKTVTVTVPRNQ
ncbi:MAG TPA: S8 family serine peptidase [Pyrinomonadaceae bacterium]